MALTLTVKTVLQFTHTKAVAGLSQGLTPQETFTKQFSYVDGTAAGQANEMYFGVRTLSGGASESLDLAGSLSNLIGDANIVFLNIKGMLIWLLSATDTLPDGTVGTACSSITVGNAANPFIGPFGAAAHTRKIVNGGVDLWMRGDADGYTVTAATADLFKVNNDDGAVSAKYLLAVWGDKT